MAKCDFTNGGTYEAPGTNETQNPGPAAPPADEGPTSTPRSLPVTKYNPALTDYIPSFADLRLPRLNIVHGVGQLKDSFPVGAIVYGSQTVVYEPKLGKKDASAPAEVVVLGWLPTRYAERVPGGGKGLLLNTEAEVRANGGTVDWKEWDLKKDSGLRYFQLLAEAVVLVRAPAGLAEEEAEATFPFIVDDVRYGLAIYGMKGTAYTNGAKTLFTARQIGVLRKGYPSFSWKMTTKAVPFGENTVPVPQFEPLRKTSESFQKFTESLINGTEDASVAETADAW